MKANRDTLLKIYKSSSAKQLSQRQLMFAQQQMANLIPQNLQYSDENYADYIGLEFASLPSPAIANEYLTNVFNRIAWIQFITMTGNRVELFNRGLTEPVTAGDTYELQYVQLTNTKSYNYKAFVPTDIEGGDLVLAQQYRLCSVKTDGTDDNPDKRKLSVHVPILTIQQALLPAITSGLASGWPEYFNEILTRSWDKFKFDRFRYLVSLTGGTPTNATQTLAIEWTNPTTTFTANDGSFVEYATKVETQAEFQTFLQTVYDYAAKLEKNYSNVYNPAGIYQVNAIDTQSIFLDSSLQTLWRTTDAILYNGEAINPRQIFKSVEFFELPASKVKTEASKVLAVLYVDYPFRHTPFTQGIRRGTQFWENNQVMGMYDNFWLTSAIDLSKPVIVFYAKTT